VPQSTLLIGERASSAASAQARLAMRQAGSTFPVRPRGPRMLLTARPPLAVRRPYFSSTKFRSWKRRRLMISTPSTCRKHWSSGSRARTLALPTRGSVVSFQPCPLPCRRDPSRFRPPPRRARASRLGSDRDARPRSRPLFGVNVPFLFGPFSSSDALPTPIEIELAGHSINPRGRRLRSRDHCNA
jgi:hypothetical protein